MDQIDKMLKIVDEILLNKQILLLIVTRGGNLLLSKELQKRNVHLISFSMHVCEEQADHVWWHFQILFEEKGGNEGEITESWATGRITT